MKKRVAYVVAALATFVLGVVVSPIHFRLYAMGCGMGSSRHFTSSYFLNLASSVRPFKSPAEADAAWQADLRKADSVIEQSSLFNLDGEQTGSRAVIRSRRQDGEQYFAVVWTEKNLLLNITSSSLAHVVAFEKQQNTRDRRNSTTTRAWSRLAR